MSIDDGIDHIRMHTCSWRVSDNGIRSTVLFNKLIGKDILHVASEEQCVVELVDVSIDFGILNSFLHIFDTDDFSGFLGYEIGDGTCAGIQVIYQFLTLKVGKIANH